MFIILANIAITISVIIIITMIINFGITTVNNLTILIIFTYYSIDAVSVINFIMILSLSFIYSFIFSCIYYYSSFHLFIYLLILSLILASLPSSFLPSLNNFFIHYFLPSLIHFRLIRFHT